MHRKKKRAALRNLGVAKIGLLGSYLKDPQKEVGEIDILVNFSPYQETFDNYMERYDFFAEFFISSKVDLVTSNGLNIL